jgi:acetyl esterase/lipase
MRVSTHWIPGCGKAWAEKSVSPLVDLQDRRYGYLWWVTDYPYQGRTVRAFFAGGNGGQVAMGVPELDLTIGFFGGNYGSPVTFLAQRSYVPEHILPAVRGKSTRSTHELKPSAMSNGKSTRTTYEFKRVGDCVLRADVYRPANEEVRPVVLWIHGGALIMGSRRSIDPGFANPLIRAGYVFVSIDYRLAPETKLPAILADVRDAYRWVREKGPTLFYANPDQIAVAGGSAGGYLTLAMGYDVQPRPCALVSLWGYGDIAGAWYSRPDPFYARQPLVSKEEAYRAVGDRVLAESTGRNNRSRFYLYCRQLGLWPKEVTGHNPDKEPRAFDPWCPLRNVSAKYPPTLLVHGTKDTDVPYEQSELMAKELKRHGVEHELLTVPEGGHGLEGVKREAVAQTYERAQAFLQRHLRAGK